MLQKTAEYGVLRTLYMQYFGLTLLGTDCRMPRL